MKLPSSLQEWKAIADEGYNFPNCFGAADGKHIAILKPKHLDLIFITIGNFIV